jgi:nucleotide-binding universal stress UspA family protein
MTAGAGYRHVALVVDGSEECRPALQEAQRLLAGGDGRLSAVHVDRSGPRTPCAVDPWIPVVMGCPAQVSHPAELHDCAMVWLQGELARLGAVGAEPAVFDSPSALCAWVREPAWT